MISIKGAIVHDIDTAIRYFDSTINYLTKRMIAYNSDIDDCRQLLRLKLWDMLRDQTRIFNESYILVRFRLDIINFINRNHEYNFLKSAESLEHLVDSRAEYKEVIVFAHEPDFDFDLDLEIVLKTAADILPNSTYEALMLFLADVSHDVIREFYNIKSRNITKFYVELADAIAVLKGALDEHS